MFGWIVGLKLTCFLTLKDVNGLVRFFTWRAFVCLGGSYGEFPFFFLSLLLVCLFYAEGPSLINRKTGEPILPALTANQYLARYWFAVRAGKMGSPVWRFIINRVPPARGETISGQILVRGAPTSFSLPPPRAGKIGSSVGRFINSLPLFITRSQPFLRLDF